VADKDKKKEEKKTPSKELVKQNEEFFDAVKMVEKTKPPAVK
jgi:hypothetical protein